MLKGFRKLDHLEEVARLLAPFFTTNHMPHMSGDPFARLLPHKKRQCFDAAQQIIEYYENA